MRAQRFAGANPSTRLGEQEARRRNAPSTGRVGASPHPIDEEERERRRLAMYAEENLGERPGDRRVQIIFLDPDEFPLLGTPLLCHPTPDAGACMPELCKLYDQRLFEFRRLSAEPQRGKIEIIERTVMRDRRLFTDEEQGLVEEVSGDFTPILGEKVRILVRVTPPYVPFEGTLRLFIGRRTNDEKKPMSTVAQIDWKDAETKNKLFELDGPRYFIIEWNGKGNKDVPREYSDRDIFDENQEKMVFIPMMEMAYADKPQRVRHGPYFIEWVQLLEKDESPAVDYAPSEEEQNELAMVVQPTIEVAIYDISKVSNEHARVLNEVGFAASNSPEKVPEILTAALAQAILGRIMRFYAGINLRFIATEGPPRTTALLFKVDCQHLFSGEGTLDALNRGGTEPTHSFDGVSLFQNLFLLHDQHAAVPKKADSWVYTRQLVNETRTDAGQEACVSAFGRVGFPPDRRVMKRPAPGDPTKHVYNLEGGPNTPRIVDGDEVVGRVDYVSDANDSSKPDSEHCAVKVDPQNGIVTVSTTNPRLVPPRRAEDIARAINACAAWLAIISVHELGHLLGASVTQSNEENVSGAPQTLPMPDGSSVGPYMNQDHEGHDQAPTAGQLMSPSTHSVAQYLGLTGPSITLRSNQLEYLRAVAPHASDFAPRSAP